MNISITSEVIQNSFEFSAYKNLLEQLLLEGKTTGNEQTEEKIGYTKINIQRISRGEKTFEILPENLEFLKSIPVKQYWILIAEAWCGDVSQNIAPLFKMAEVNSFINFRIILRDDNPEIINNYLTNNARSIPKLVILDENLVELAVWGPRPKGATEIYNQYKANPGITKELYHNNLHLWYSKNKGLDLQNEIIEIEKKLLLHV